MHDRRRNDDGCPDSGGLVGQPEITSPGGTIGLLASEHAGLKALYCDHTRAIAIDNTDTSQQVFYVLLSGGKGEDEEALWLFVIVDRMFRLDVGTCSLTRAELREEIVEIYGAYPIV